MDCYVVFSSCPQDIVKIQGEFDNKPKSVEIEINQDAQTFSEIKTTNTWIPNT
jgi:hypothetical protein